MFGFRFLIKYRPTPCRAFITSFFEYIDASTITSRFTTFIPHMYDRLILEPYVKSFAPEALQARQALCMYLCHRDFTELRWPPRAPPAFYIIRTSHCRMAALLVSVFNISIFQSPVNADLEGMWLPQSSIEDLQLNHASALSLLS